jgi:hypothetical protein
MMLTNNFVVLLAGLGREMEKMRENLRGMRMIQSQKK